MRMRIEFLSRHLYGPPSEQKAKEKNMKNLLEYDLEEKKRKKRLVKRILIDVVITNESFTKLANLSEIEWRLSFDFVANTQQFCLFWNRHEIEWKTKKICCRKIQKVWFLERIRLISHWHRLKRSIDCIQNRERERGKERERKEER